MSTELTVAEIALVISLIALFIASGQLTQQIFSTADGYRRCQESVIGSWAKKTRLVWRWSQFRFETKFTTPEIVLYDDTAGFEIMKRSYTMKSVVDLKQAQLSMKGIESMPSSDRPPNNDAVTWLAFLYQLSRQEDARRDLLASTGTRSDSKIGVIYRERTWDLMPPDVSLPVASSRLGTIVALALRLGMTWENLEISEGFLRASGNGHTLVSTTIRGLGITFQYTFNDDLGALQNFLNPLQVALPHSKDPALSKATDLIRCGIVPGCSRLEIPPIPLAGQTVNETVRYLRAAFRLLGVPEETISYLTQPGPLKDYSTANNPVVECSMPINDMIALCSERWPQMESVVWPLKMDVLFSSFLFWECRESYRIELEESLQRKNNLHIRQVWQRLFKLQTAYSHDWYCRWNKAMVTNPMTPIDRKRAFLKNLQSTHDWTTEYFQTLAGTVPYRFFVALHILLTLDANRYVRAQGLWNAELWTALPKHCVNNLPNIHIGSRPYIGALVEPDVLPQEKIIEAWWTLILRGISWKMMMHVESGAVSMPSKFYLDQTPVYIM